MDETNGSEEDEGEEDGDEYYHEPINSVRYEMMHAYDPYDLKGVTAPWLQDGDRKARDEFRIKYIAYLQKHQNKMRKRPMHQRLLPATVVECIRPALLAYIRKHLLNPGFHILKMVYHHLYIHVIYMHMSSKTVSKLFWMLFV